MDTEHLYHELDKIISDALTWRDRLNEVQEYAWWIFDDKEEEFLDNEYWSEIHIDAGETALEVNNIYYHARELQKQLKKGILENLSESGKVVEGTAAELFPHDTGEVFLKLWTDFGDGEKWCAIRSVWRGNDKVNFSLRTGGGWLALDPDTEIKIKEIPRD